MSAERLPAAGAQWGWGALPWLGSCTQGFWAPVLRASELLHIPGTLLGGPLETLGKAL